MEQHLIGEQNLTNPQQIYSILNAVQKARTPVTIKFEGREKYYTSLILKTDLEAGYLIIDEVAPADGHVLALQQHPFSIRGSHAGVSLFFRSNVIDGSGTENGIAFYRLPLPAKMLYQQRRSAFRALVPRALDIRCELKGPGGILCGRLHDISVGGCRINFAGELRPAPEPGARFESAQVPLQDGAVLRYPLILKHSRYNRETGETSCGFQFEGVDKAGQRLLDRFVYFLQREARRLETR